MSNKGFKDFFKEAEQQLSEFAGAAQRILLPKIKPRPRPKPMPDQPKPGEAPTRPEKEVPGKPIPPKPVEPVPEPKPVPDQKPVPKPVEPVPEPKPVPDQKPVPKPIVPIAPLPDSSPKPNVEPESKPKTQPSPIPVPPGETKSGETKPTPIAPLPIPIDQEQGKKLDFWRWGRAPAGEPVGPYRSDKEMGYVKEFKNMTDIQKSLYIIETMSTAEKHPTGPKFPGYWKGTDPASAAKDRMVGGSEEQQESVLGELDKTAKDTAIRRTLEEKYKAFKEQDDQTKSLEGPVNIYPKMFPKRPATPTTMDPKDIDPAAIAMLVPGTIGLGAQGLTYSPELAPGTIYPPGQNPYSTPATKSDHLAAIRKADADAARQQSAPAASKTVPKAPATASGPLIRPDDESAAEKARLQRPSVNAPVSTPQPQKVAPTVSEPAGSAAKTQPNVEPAVPTDQGPVGYQGLDPSGRKTATTDPRSSTFGTAAPSADNAPAAALKPTTYQELQKLNPFIKDANKIYVGQKITAPNGDEYIVQKGDTLSKIAADWNKQMGFTTAPVKPVAPPATPQAGSSAKIQPVPPNAVTTQYGDVWRDSQGNPITSGSSTDADGRPIQLPPAFATKPQKQTAFDQEQDKEYRKGIGQREGMGRYDTTFGDRIDKDGNLVHKYMPPPKPITDMTIQELQAWQKERSAKDKGTGAVGMYGFMPGVVDEYSKKAGLKPTDKFDSVAQEKIQSAIMADQRATLEKNNIPVNAATMYMAHYVGPTGAVRVKTSTDPNQAVVDAVIDPKYKSNPEAYKAERDKLLLRNPELGKIKVGDFETVLAQRVSQGQIAAQRQQKQQGTQVAMRESDDKKVAGRYSYDEFDDMIDRLRVKAKEQEKKHGPVDLGKLMQRLRDIDNKDDKPIKEEEPPNLATNPTMQATNAARQATNPAQQDTQAGQQATSQAGTVQQQQQRRDQALDTSTARGVADTIASVAPPGTNPDALAQGIVNANDGKPLSMDQQKAMSTITPLVLKAAETPVAAGALKTALQQAGVLAKQGK